MQQYMAFKHNHKCYSVETLHLHLQWRFRAIQKTKQKKVSLILFHFSTWALRCVFPFFSFLWDAAQSVCHCHLRTGKAECTKVEYSQDEEKWVTDAFAVWQPLSEKTLKTYLLGLVLLGSPLVQRSSMQLFN